MRIVRRCLVATACLALATPAAAQDDEGGAFLALSFTPVGALPVNAMGADLATAPRRFDVLLGRRYLFGEYTNIGVGYTERSGAGRVGVRLAIGTCDGCNELVMAGIDYEAVLARREAPDGSVSSIGLMPSIGASRPIDGDLDVLYLSGALGVPFSYVAGRDWRVGFFVSPGAGFGRATVEDRSAQGVRPMIGAGMRASSPGGVGLVLGIQHVFLEEVEPLYGMAVTVGLGGRPASPSGQPLQRR